MCFGFDILIYGCALQLHSCNLIFDKDVFYFSITLLHPVFMSKKMKATRWSQHKRTNVCMFWIKTMIKYFMLYFHKQLATGTCGGGVDSSFWAIWSSKNFQTFIYSETRSAYKIHIPATWSRWLHWRGKRVAELLLRHLNSLSACWDPMLLTVCSIEQILLLSKAQWRWQSVALLSWEQIAVISPSLCQ